MQETKVLLQQSREKLVISSVAAYSNASVDLLISSRIAVLLPTSLAMTPRSTTSPLFPAVAIAPYVSTLVKLFGSNGVHPRIIPDRIG